MLHRFLDLLAVARGGDLLAAQHPPLHARTVGAAEVEPGLGILRRPPGPLLRRADRPFDRGSERGIEPPVLGVELDLPPQRRRLENVARFGRRRPAGAAELRVDLVEARIENELVGANERVFPAQRVARRQRRNRAAYRFLLEGNRASRAGGLRVRVGEHRAAAEGDHHSDGRHSTRQRHVRLVRSCCLAAWRSSARLIRRSSSVG